MKERFDQLRAMGIRTIMITGDNPLTAAAIAREAGVDDFLAEAKPKDKMDLIKREQAEGKLVAMTGDGTNDAPALAQADVGVAMNTGTQAAKEAGNMVDLDSNPTKLIEIVEIGKQLLMTRGALTTFSIANDVAKYFAIIPAMFAGVFPVLNALNIMHLHNAESAILSAVIFNALIIIALIPLALRGVSYRPMSAAALLQRNLSSTASAASSCPSSASSSSTCSSPPSTSHKSHERTNASITKNPVIPNEVKDPCSCSCPCTLPVFRRHPERSEGPTVLAVAVALVVVCSTGLAGGFSPLKNPTKKTGFSPGLLLLLFFLSFPPGICF